MAAPVSLRYRLIVGIILLAAFVFFWAIHWFELLSTYERILRFLGVPAFVKMPFADFHQVLSAAECYRQGVDVYVTNPCDVLGRRYIYSPLLIALIPARLGTTDTWWTGSALAILFLLS